MALAALLAFAAGATPALAQGIEDDESAQVAERVTSDLSLDEETVLLALALSNGGDVDISVDDLVEGGAVVERATVVDRDVTLDEDTVFSALALDLDADDLLLSDGDLSLDAIDSSEDLEALEDADLDEDVFLASGDGGSALAVGDVETALVQTRAEDRAVDLDRDDVFLALALGNALDDDLEFEDVADLDRTVVVQQDLDRSVNIDEDDAFLALALGEGG